MPIIDKPIKELCVDGGNIRLRTELTCKSDWRDYEAIATDAGIVANLQNNSQLLERMSEK